MKRSYLITLSLLLLSSFSIITSGQQQKKTISKQPIGSPINVDTSELKNNISAPYNLFYLSKYLDNAILNPNETELIYGSLVNLVGKDKLDAVGKDSPYRSIANFKKKAINAKALFITKLLNEKRGSKDSPSLNSLADLLEKYNRKNDEIAAINGDIGVLNIRKREVDNAIIFLREFTQNPINQDSVSVIKKYQELLDTSKSPISSVSQLNKLLDLRNKSLDDSIKKEVGKIDTSGTLMKAAKELSDEIDKETKHLADSLLKMEFFQWILKAISMGSTPLRKNHYR